MQTRPWLAKAAAIAVAMAVATSAAAIDLNIMLQTVQLSLKVINDNAISRTFAGMEGMEINYHRCSL